MKRWLFAAAATAAVAVAALVPAASAGTWTLSLTATPNPVLAGATATFSGTLVNPGGQGVPDKSVVVRAYGHDSTCSGAYDAIGPVLTSHASGKHGKYSVTSAVPAGAAGAYYVKAYATVDDRQVVSACVLVTVTPAPTVTIADNPQVAEGGNLVYTVQLAYAAASTVTVSIGTDAGFSLATAGSDYTPNSSTLTFLAGETSKTFTVATIDDNRDDIDTGFNGEYVWAHITSVTGPVTLPVDFTTNLATDDRWGLGVILDDELAPTLTLSNNPVAAEGSPLDFTVTLSHPSDYTLTAALDTEEGFNDLSDYTPKAENLVFSPGETSETFSVDTTQDATYEGPTTLGPGDGIWVHVDSITGGPVLSTDFTTNLATDDLWSLGFIDDTSDAP